MVENTGMIMMPVEAPKVQVYFVPHLGSAPKFCSFLDCLTEEMEEEHGTGISGQNSYDNYRFLTLPEIKELNIEPLIGTKMLRAYMHGYFIDSKLYNRIQSEKVGMSMEEKMAEMMDTEIQKLRKSRISLDKISDKKVSKTVKSMADSEDEDGSESGSEPEEKAGSESDDESADQEAEKEVNKNFNESDDRFGDLFKNKAYEIDSDDDAFIMRNTEKSAKKLRKLLRENDDFEDSDEEKEIAKREKRMTKNATKSAKNGQNSDLADGENSDADSSDDEKNWLEKIKNIKSAYKQVYDKKALKNEAQKNMDKNIKLNKNLKSENLTVKIASSSGQGHKKSGSGFKKMDLDKKSDKLIGKSLDAVTREQEPETGSGRNFKGNQEMSFKMKKEKDKKSDAQQKLKQVQKFKNRKQRRSAMFLLPKDVKYGKK